MGDLYSAQLMDHLRNPRNVGSLDDANVVVQARDPECGDLLLYLLRIEESVVRDIKFLVKGCGTAMAASSMATEMAKGKNVDEVLSFTEDTIADALGGLPKDKMHCAEMAVAALHAAMQEYLDFPGTPEVGQPGGAGGKTSLSPVVAEKPSSLRSCESAFGRRRRSSCRATQPCLL